MKVLSSSILSKFCRKCQQTKKISFFYNNKTGIGRIECKSCVEEYKIKRKKFNFSRKKPTELKCIRCGYDNYKFLDVVNNYLNEKQIFCKPCLCIYYIERRIGETLPLQVIYKK